MRERPILFSAPMVRAILEGRKSMTRRIMRRQPHDGVDAVSWQPQIVTGMNTPDQAGFAMMRDGIIESYAIICPYGMPGDRLWVRENFLVRSTDGAIQYRADFKPSGADKKWKWKSSICMPRRASRITLEITAVRCERLQEITEKDALAEGVCDDGNPGVVYPNGAPPIVNAFWRLWDRLNAKRGYGYDANPWVWVVEFKRVDSGR